MRFLLKLLLFSWCVFFLGWLIVYKTGINQLAIQSEDTLPAMFLPLTILRSETLYADEYYPMIVARYPHPDDKKYVKGLTPFYLKRVGTHYVSAFPIITGMLVLPVYTVPLLFGIVWSWESIIAVSHIAAALIISLSGCFLYLLIRNIYPGSRRDGVLLTLSFLFATVNFASISQALWQHGTLELFTILGLFYLFKTPGKISNIFWSGLFLGFAVISRPTAALPFAILGVFILARYKINGALRYAWGSLFPALFFIYYNTVYYGSISNQGYASQIFDSWRTPFYLGFAGIWLSPSKGLLIYSPIFFFSILGAWLVWKKPGLFKNLDITLFRIFAVIVFLHTLIIGMWKHWYGGWAFGYRMASDIIPYLILLLIPYMQSPYYVKTKRLFYLAFAWSVGIELMGLAFFDGVWHAAYDRGPKDQSWLWSLANSEIVFNIKRLLLKVHLIKPFLP